MRPTVNTAAIYTSSARPDHEAIRRQREQCEALARTLGCRATVLFADEAGDRTALGGLLQHANAGRVDAVVVWHIGVQPGGAADGDEQPLGGQEPGGDLRPRLGPRAV